ARPHEPAGRRPRLRRRPCRVPAYPRRPGADERGARLDRERAFARDPGGTGPAPHVGYARRIAVLPARGRPDVPDARDPDDASDVRRDPRVAGALLEGRGAARVFSGGDPGLRGPHDPCRGRGPLEGPALLRDPRRLEVGRRRLRHALGARARGAGAPRPDPFARDLADPSARPRRRGLDGVAGDGGRARVTKARRIGFGLAFAAVLALRLALFVRFSENYDTQSYAEVVRAMEAGRSPWETGRYNYSPVWAGILVALSGASRAIGASLSSAVGALMLV